MDLNFDELNISDNDVAGYEASGNDVAGGDPDDDDGAYRPETQKAEPKFQPASALLPDVGAMGSAAARTAAKQEDGKLSGHQRVLLTNADTESMDQSWSSTLLIPQHSSTTQSAQTHMSSISLSLRSSQLAESGIPANDQKFYTKDGGVLIPRRE